MVLEEENGILREKLFDLEYRQWRNNLIFEGINDSQNETDLETMCKVCLMLRGISGLDSETFKIERCHRLGTFRVNTNRWVICYFNWFQDIQCILKNRKHLPKGIFVNEDLPEEWVNRRKVLKPIYNVAK